MNKLTAMLLCTLCITGNALRAQERTCGLVQAEQNLYEKTPDLKSQVETLNQLIQQNKTPGKLRGEIIIPVVFHIVHNFGPENISDAQVYDAMKRINDDYHKLNADAANTVSPFDTIAANCNFTFKLATKDPQGRCTNGIDRIVSYKTYYADDQSKLNQWNPFKYLNIWVVNSLGNGTAAAYAYKPATAQYIPYYDGIIALYDYVGGISPSNLNNQHTLSHEIGHYLNLDHTWGGTNNPGVSCGDDGVNDTPETKGHSTCPAYDASCHPGTPENIQNFMEYSYCSTMFTRDQKTRMESTLAGNVAQRKNLLTDANHNFTGCLLARPDCAPHSEFKVARNFSCIGTGISVNAASWGDSNYTYQWYAPDGTFTSSTSASTTVTFSTSGWKSIGLVTSSNAGTDSIYKANFIYIYDDSHSMSTELNSFENITANEQWTNLNYFHNDFSWKFSDQVGFWGNRSIMYEGYDQRTGIGQYYNSANNDWDDLISPKVDLSNLGAQVYMNFRYTSASGNIQLGGDSLVLFYSTTCGNTWTKLKTFKLSSLHIGYYNSAAFVPWLVSQWKQISIPLPSTALSNGTFFKFQYRPDEYSNNFYLDNLEFTTNPTTVSSIPIGQKGLQVFPNPGNGSFQLQGQFGSASEEVQYEVYSLTGQKIYSGKGMLENGKLDEQINIQSYVKSGSYLLKVRSSTESGSVLLSIY